MDVVRDGRTAAFRALGDRTQAPSGLGYALVNRTILSRVLPTLHRESGVERLAGFFRPSGPAVAAAAPEGVDEPRVVILTPGPLSETYFEHAYLASYLGYAAGRRAGPGGQQQPGLATIAERASTRSTWSSDGSTTSGATRSSSGPTRSSGFPVCWKSSGGAG